MRTLRQNAHRGWVRRLVPSCWYMRGWLALAKCMYFLGFPPSIMRRVLAKDGLLWNGWQWLYGDRP